MDDEKVHHPEGAQPAEDAEDRDLHELTDKDLEKVSGGAYNTPSMYPQVGPPGTGL